MDHSDRTIVVLRAEDGEGGGPQARAAAFATLVEALNAAGRKRPHFIAIDELHRANPASLQLLQALAAAGPALPVGLVLTARVDPVDVPEATRDALAELPTGLRRVAVPPLEERWAAGLVRHVGGADRPGRRGVQCGRSSGWSITARRHRAGSDQVGSHAAD